MQIAVSATLWACSGVAATGAGDASAAYYRATTPTGATLVLEAKRTDAERARGMMGRTEAPAGTGMLFLFPETSEQSFWMYNCLIPLDIVWLSEDHTVVHLERNLPPCRSQPCPTYSPGVPARYVIEVAAGEADRLGLRPGAKVLFEPFDPERP